MEKQLGQHKPGNGGKKAQEMYVTGGVLFKCIYRMSEEE